ncbi:cyclopropane-fatty-acyl-phospholipid synthase [Frankineae bacterium MT45]|nr:cyclopropane-fatty-acyl-phospholipid synthase [Frankineae bacterium MT45]
MQRTPTAKVLYTTLGHPELQIKDYDDVSAGSPDAKATITVRSPKALSYMISAPSTLGLARAYVSEELEVEGDLYEALSAIWNDGDADVRFGARVQALLNLDPKALRWVAPPSVEIGPRGLMGLRHSKRRDAQVISHHYDISNKFYEYILGPSMTYTCACYPEETSTLEEAQAHKYDLVCRKLGLKPGMRLLDVGCGWGGMVRHAAKHYGVKALGVTLSQRQAEWAAAAITRDGLDGVAEVRYMDYRDVDDSGYDAISSIGLTEHIGMKELPNYFASLYAKLRPEGRLLNHCITRPTTTEGVKSEGFIDRYVFPDGELEAVGVITGVMQDAGFEVRHEENLREHYAMTLAAWGRNLEENWDAAVAEVGLERARVWRLYMAGSRLGFERRGIELHQVLGVRVGNGGKAGVPLRPDWGV